MYKKLLTLLLLTILTTPLMAQMPTPDQTMVYKQTEQRDLELHIFYPNDQQKGKNRPVVVSFFGGGWAGGDVNQFFDQSEFYASIGMVGISVDYRVIGKDGTTPFESVMDAKSAVRWVRKNSKRLGIDPNKIVTSGGSAGGHLAACTALIEGCEDEGENLKISSVPNAMMLFNPVVNTTKIGYGANKLEGRETEISPYHHVRPSLPPSIVMHGTQDTTVPYQNAVDFVAAMVAQGNECRLISGFGENHGFFNSPEFRASNGARNYNRALYESACFLVELGYISQEMIPQREPIRIACLGNSITYGSRVEDREKNSYPAVLQSLLGEQYEVVNFGKSGATLLSKGNVPYVQTIEYDSLISYSPDVIIIKLGTNDSKSTNWIHKDEFEGDFDTLINKLRSSNTRRPQIYVCSPVPAFTPADSKSINSAIIANEVIPMVQSSAKRNKAVYIDLYHPFEKNSSVFPDKIHPNAEGASRLAHIIYNAIAQKEVVTK